jgi:uncharacterized Fe-S center protein
MVVLSHFKGHEVAGFGGAIKNLAMGCAPPAGKQQQHSARLMNVEGAVCGMREMCGSMPAACHRTGIREIKHKKGGMHRVFRMHDRLPGRCHRCGLDHGIPAFTERMVE